LPASGSRREWPGIGAASGVAMKDDFLSQTGSQSNESGMRLRRQVKTLST
jgi:hypothetical protein